jgi:crotonobetainyl-CoA:carnitine CoA-transferase CaiB-like acyl-CoA transferase
MGMPLESIKIIQMECFGPANFAAWMLGDLGADILLVELPNGRSFISS